MEQEEQPITFDYSLAFKELTKIKNLLKENKLGAAKDLYWDMLKKTCSYAFAIHHEFTESDIEARFAKSRHYDKPHKSLLELYKKFSSKKFSKEGFQNKAQFDSFIQGIENTLADLQKIKQHPHIKHEHSFFFKPIDAVEKKIEAVKEKYEEEKEKIKKELERIHEPRKPIKKQFGKAFKSFLEYEEAKFHVRKRKKHKQGKLLPKLLKVLFLKNKTLRTNAEHIDLFPFNVKEAILGRHQPMIVYKGSVNAEHIPESSVRLVDSPGKWGKKKMFFLKLDKKRLKAIELHEKKINKRLKRL